MSLADQSQQWFPTSVQVTVHQARGLRVKGKSGTNDSYAIIQVAKDKFSTSVAEKSVAPVWKEEASFDLPLFHPSNAERCTLYIIVMHRAQVGLDKFLGQAVVKLLELYDNKARKKSDWFKLVDKTGKEDKARGEVLLDIQFMRNNMSASMFDLSMQDKPRSRISKLKDKVRGKKKDGFPDSVSAIVPSVSQVLTDSETEADSQSLNQSPGVKKKSKLKTLFAPKSNLQRNISQSMSTLGSLPEKNSSLSSSRSSGLNVDTPEVKKKFKLLGHKRTGSSDSRVSQGPFSLLGRSKQNNTDPNSLCINGSHVYTEDPESKSGSTASLNSSGQGSQEDMRKHPSADSGPDRAILEQQRHLEEEERRQAEERRVAEAKRLEQEEKHRMEVKRLQEEEERRMQEEKEFKKRFLEEEEERKRKQKEEEEQKALEAAEKQRLAEEQKRQEEASMSDRLTSLFGMIRKKEEKKEEVQQLTKDEFPPKPPRVDSGDHNQPRSNQSANPFEDIPLNSGRQEGSNEEQKSSRSQIPSAMVFLNRTAKVSAVKPRLPQSLESEPTDSQNPNHLNLPPDIFESTVSSVPSESPDNFSTLHSSLAPSNITSSPSSSPGGIAENLSFLESVDSMADKKKRAPQPPSISLYGTQNGGSPTPIREISNPAYVEADKSQQVKKMSVPLPDYETLFPQKRHGVQGQTRWDHIIAEVNQRHRDLPPEFSGPEMSVDGPEDQGRSMRTSPLPTHSAQYQETKPVSSKKAAAPQKSPAPPYLQPAAEFNQRHSPNAVNRTVMQPNPPVAPATNRDALGRESPSLRPEAKKALQPPSATRAVSQWDVSSVSTGDQSPMQVEVNNAAPKAKPRQRASGHEMERQADSAVTPLNSNNQVLSDSSTSGANKNSRWPRESFADIDPFPSTDLFPKDAWAQVKHNQHTDDPFRGSTQKDQKIEDLGMTPDDLDNIFRQDKAADPFAVFNGSDSKKDSVYRGKYEPSEQASPAFQSRQPEIVPSTTLSDSKTPQPSSTYKDESSISKANQGIAPQPALSESVAAKHHADMKTSPANVQDDPFGTEPFSAWSSSHPLHVVHEEPESQAESMSSGKLPLRAWVSPSDGQSVSAQSSNGGGLAFAQRRPHPVKPMSSVESPHPISTPAVKDIRVRDSTVVKNQADPVESGPYTQLTHEELITLVVKQQTDLSRKDAKIMELEEYIDNLLVRVIEEKPAILQSLKAYK